VAEKELTMLQSALQRLRISRNGQCTMLVVDGQGAAVVPTMDFSTVQKWAQSKASAPNANQSMMKILDKLEVAITRPGTTFAATRGSPKYVADLARQMISAGFDINEWSLPPDVKEAATARADAPPPKKPASTPDDTGTHG
jgi:hypothetical protein